MDKEMIRSRSDIGQCLKLGRWWREEGAEQVGPSSLASPAAEAARPAGLAWAERVRCFCLPYRHPALETSQSLAHYVRACFSV